MKKATRQEELDQIIPEYIKTLTGKQFKTYDLLDLASENYRLTRQSYTLNKKSNKLVKTRPTKKTNAKYTREDAVWMQEHTPQEIADRYNITVKQAHGVKHYCRQFYCITL